MASELTIAERRFLTPDEEAAYEDAVIEDAINEELGREDAEIEQACLEDDIYLAERGMDSAWFRRQQRERDAWKKTLFTRASQPNRMAAMSGRVRARRRERRNSSQTRGPRRARAPSELPDEPPGGSDDRPAVAPPALAPAGKDGVNQAPQPSESHHLELEPDLARPAGRLRVLPVPLFPVAGDGRAPARKAAA